MRIGIGYDVHKLVKGRKLILGGLEIPYNKGLLGHSDGDVLIHSIIDALLGAGGLGDIGKYFPSISKKYKNISSLILLKDTEKILAKKKIKIINIDATIIIEEPKISNYFKKMKTKITEVLKINEFKINIKATTNEGLGFIGRKEGIAAFSVALVK